MAKPFAGVVLAGGKSSRMGQDKALLSINGQDLLTRAKLVLEQLGATEVLLSRNDQQATSLADLYPEQGPLGGIYSALMATKLPLLCLAVDMPLVDVRLLKPLLASGISGNQISHFIKQPLPLFVPNNSAVKNYLLAALTAQTDRSIRGLISAVGGQEIPSEYALQLKNANTPKQWQVLKQQLNSAISSQFDNFN